MAIKTEGGQTALVGNTLHLSGAERVLVVSGPNQGGKTTFARTIGQCAYLASLGCPVPAKRAVFTLPDAIYTHFDRQENLSTPHGKLHDELVRIRDILSQATAASLIIMNESFSSTTVSDALLIGTEIIRRIINLDSTAVYVSFLNEPSRIGPACVSMVGEVAAFATAPTNLHLHPTTRRRVRLCGSVGHQARPDLRHPASANDRVKVRLLHPEHDVDLTSRLAWRVDALITDDLELNRIYDAMAAGENFLLETAKAVLTRSTTDPAVITYRQHVLADTLANRSLVQQIYDIAAGVDGLELRHKVFLGGLKSKDPAAILRRSVRIMELLTDTLRELRNRPDRAIHRPIPLPRTPAARGHARPTGLRHIPHPCRRLPLRIPTTARRALEFRKTPASATPQNTTFCTSHLDAHGWAASPTLPAGVTNSRSIPMTCPVRRRSPSWLAVLSTTSPTPSRNGPSTSNTSSADYGSSWRFTSAAPTCITGWPCAASPPATRYPPRPSRTNSTAGICATSDSAWQPATPFKAPPPTPTTKP